MSTTGSVDDCRPNEEHCRIPPTYFIPPIDRDRRSIHLAQVRLIKIHLGGNEIWMYCIRIRQRSYWRNTRNDDMILTSAWSWKRVMYFVFKSLCCRICFWIFTLKFRVCVLVLYSLFCISIPDTWCNISHCVQRHSL